MQMDLSMDRFTAFACSTKNIRLGGKFSLARGMILVIKLAKAR